MRCAHLQGHRRFYQLFIARSDLVPLYFILFDEVLIYECGLGERLLETIKRHA